jgi:nicotinamidase/pyrazinamidase
LIFHYKNFTHKPKLHSIPIGIQQKSLSIPLLLIKLGFSKILQADKFLKKWWTCLNKKFVIEIGDVLLITDIQKDFLPGGALPIDNGNEIIPVLNEYIRNFYAPKAHVLVSRDWHPTDHVSFNTQGGPWPPHCIKDTNGAEFSSDLKLPKHTLIISKATEPNHESYSAFDGTILANELKRLGVKRMFIGGLATDYCVVNTVLDARKLGIETVVLMDATLGINVNPGDVDSAIETMVTNGAQQATVDDFSEPVDELPIEETQIDGFSEKPSQRAEVKKKARMRPKGSAKRIRTEHG